jgi:hypothetical protein
MTVEVDPYLVCELDGHHWSGVAPSGERVCARCGARVEPGDAQLEWDDPCCE